MNRLVRAEMYRFLHSNHLTIWLVVLCFIFVTIVACTDVFSMDLGEMLGACGDVCLMMDMFISVFPAIVVGLGYMRKTAYYEVMAGNKISCVLCSKIIVDAVPVAVCSFISACIIPVMVYVQNGLGDATQVIQRFALYFVVLLHVCVCSALMATALRHIAAAILVYIRFSAFDLIVLLILSLAVDGMATVPTWYEGVRNCFIMNQLSHIFLGEITSEFVITVFVSLIFESAFWYIVSYIGMKKKLYG